MGSTDMKDLVIKLDKEVKDKFVETQDKSQTLTGCIVAESEKFRCPKPYMLSYPSPRQTAVAARAEEFKKQQRKEKRSMAAEEKQLHLRLPKSVYEKMQAQADSLHMTMSAYISFIAVSSEINVISDKLDSISARLDNLRNAEKLLDILDDETIEKIRALKESEI